MNNDLYKELHRLQLDINNVWERVVESQYKLNAAEKELNRIRLVIAAISQENRQ